MTATMKSLSASSELSRDFEGAVFPRAELPETSTQPDRSVVVSIDRNRPKVLVAPTGFVSIEELNIKSSRIDSRKAALEDARRRLAAELSGGSTETVKTFRLKKGWSQTQLADAIGTSQPHIARIERGTENVTIDTCRRLAKALDLDLNTLDKALRCQEAAATARA